MCVILKDKKDLSTHVDKSVCNFYFLKTVIAQIRNVMRAHTGFQWSVRTVLPCASFHDKLESERRKARGRCNRC
jgi:hypothetical protein